MSRWGRGRSGSVAVPLDSALFRENSNYPTAARSAGTVGKWGITSFTSIRSAPYAYASSAPKKPVQDQNSPLTVPAVETEQPPPKPKKFFKSRNAEPYPPVPQITYAPPVVATPLSPDHASSSKDKKANKRSRVYNRDSSSPELPRRASEKGKAKKSVATKAAKREDSTADNSQPPNKRYLVRNRNKVINYAEDGSNSPIPDFTRYESLASTAAKVIPEVREKIPSPKVSPPLISPSLPKADIESPSTSKDSNEERKPPPIVLRISKGTSRIVSTDSNEGFTSPSSDRHSSMDTHSDFGSEHKKSPSMETICSPRQEGLKITIKCGGLTQETKKEKKKEKKEHKHKKHHKSSDDEPLINKKTNSPLPGTEAYELYKTLASPVHVAGKIEKDLKPPIDEIESQLAQLDAGPAVPKTPLFEPQQPESVLESKTSESSIGRSRRARQVINYSENDDFMDALTTGKNKLTKTVSELKKESKKSKKKLDSLAEAAPALVPDTALIPETQESHLDDNDLIDILAGGEGKPSTEPYKAKVHKKPKHKYGKQSSPEHIEPVFTQEPNDNLPVSSQGEVEAQPSSSYSSQESQNQQSSEEFAVTPSLSNDKVFDYDAKKHSEFKSPGHIDTNEQSEDKPSVKLVITKKKGSIFKSKSLVSDNDASPLPARKRRHLYRHEWANDKGNETPRPETAETPEARNITSQVPEELTRVTRYREPDPIVENEIKPYTSVRCPKEAKEYYTVVRNVKTAHQIQEIGEFQEFNDDVEYLLDALQHNNPISTRCLSAITLASKCTAPAFRMHVRAHGTVQKFFGALRDATNDQRLGLCTATVMFVLSQDRLNMDLDRESLELMLNLLESDASHKDALDDCGLTSAQLTKTQERVRELCAEIKSQGKAKHLDLDNITVGHLAMETLLSLTSKRAGEWFKEELRVLGGVDHIVRTIKDCSAKLETPAESWSGADIDILRKADRCMRVLENVTQMNEDNQLYLLKESLQAASLLSGLLCRCINEARTSQTIRTHLLDAALPAVKVLVNLSHSFGNNSTSLGATIIGSQPSLMETCLIMLDNPDSFIPDENNFDFSVCVLMLLTNLVQNNECNTQRLLTCCVSSGDVTPAPAMRLLLDLFYKRVDLARRAEENTDALLDGKEKDTDQDKDKKKQSSQDDIEETVAKLLARAGSHMEHTMVGAYTALLLGHAAVGSPAAAAALAQLLPSYQPLLPTLRKYYTFLELTASAEQAIVAHVKSTHRIIQYMEKCDKEAENPTTEAPPTTSYNNYPGQYYQTSPSDMPQDMSLSNLNYSKNYSNSSSDRMSSSIDSYH